MAADDFQNNPSDLASIVRLLEFQRKSEAEQARERSNLGTIGFPAENFAIPSTQANTSSINPRLLAPPGGNTRFHFTGGSPFPVDPGPDRMRNIAALVNNTIQALKALKKEQKELDKIPFPDNHPGSIRKR